MTVDLKIERFDPAEASAIDFASYHDVLVAAHEVDRPEEPWLPIGEMAARMKTPLPGMGTSAYWVGRRDDKIEAFAEAYFLDAENSRIALVDVKVIPGRRRMGIGIALLRAVLPELRTRQRQVIESWEVVKGRPGQAFAEALGFRQVRGIVRQALVPAEVDVSSWEVDVPAGYRMLRWCDVAPEEVVGSYAVARGAINDAPLGESNYRWPEWTVKRVRAAEADARAQGLVRRVVVALHEVTGTVAGFTEVLVHPRRPDWGYQRDTAVLAGHRGHGLGFCMKAHMAQWLVADLPALKRISTTTGTENAHMIRVNQAVGYRTLPTVLAVQQDLASLEFHLARRSNDRSDLVE